MNEVTIKVIKGPIEIGKSSVYTIVTIIAINIIPVNY